MKKQYRQWGVRGSIWLFAAVAALGALAQGAVGWVQSREAERISGELRDAVQVERALGIVDMVHDGLRGTTFQAQVVGAAGPAAERQAVQDELREYRTEILAALAKAEPLIHDGPTREAIAAARPLVEAYAARAQQMVDAAFTDAAAAQRLRPQFDADFRQLEGALDALSGLVEAHAEALAEQRKAMVERDRWLTPLCVLATLAAILGYGLPFANRLLRRLGAEPPVLAALARRVAAGDLHTPFAAGAPGSVADAMATMRDRLAEAVRTIRDGAVQVAAGSEQIRSGNQDLAQRTEHQAARLQQAAASLHQMQGGVQQTAENARSARDVAAAAAEVAAAGGDAVRRVVDTMGDIQSHSRRIAEIIGVIDSIAFQTNILALNAAVEAARAGEQGRGFAVVAGEVRGLAQRSAGAAREIKSLIDSSVARVEDGGRIVAEAGRTMEQLVERVGTVHTLIGGISGAAQEQTQGIGVVNDSVATLDNATQQNAALVEEASAGAASLEEQAQRLAASVAAFRLAPG